MVEGIVSTGAWHWCRDSSVINDPRGGTRPHAVAQLVESLRYKPEGSGLDSRWCHWNFFNVHTMAPGSTQPLTEINTRNTSWRVADNLTTFICRLSWNLGASTSWNPQGLFRPVMGLLYLFLLDSCYEHGARNCCQCEMCFTYILLLQLAVLPSSGVTTATDSMFLLT